MEAYNSDAVALYGDVMYENGHEDGFEAGVMENSMDILEDAGWRLVRLIVERINSGPSEDNFLEEALEDTFEEFMSAVYEEGAEEDEVEEHNDL